MPRVRRHDLAPRVEMLPMLDVIFLLLTFFIYAMVMMVQAQVLPVRLTAVGTGQQASPADITAITIDRAGHLYLDRRRITPEALDAKLGALAKQPDPPALFLAMQAGAGEDPEGTVVDRAPLLIHLIERVQAAGLRDFQIVGPPAKASAGAASLAQPPPGAP